MQLYPIQAVEKTEDIMGIVGFKLSDTRIFLPFTVAYKYTLCR